MNKRNAGKCVIDLSAFNDAGERNKKANKSKCDDKDSHIPLGKKSEEA